VAPGGGSTPPTITWLSSPPTWQPITVTVRSHLTALSQRFVPAISAISSIASGCSVEMVSPVMPESAQVR
jgi:hypothetical protein